jgi:DNA processing protein
VIVVSGLAAGVDTAAHTSTICAGGQTIAVLGTPLHVAYPKENRELQTRIMQEHLAVSQFEIGQPTHKTHFPMRNRVMALISDATVIVEASDGSGTIHQGWEAIRLGRPLFIMKSVTEDQSLTWPAKMLSYGALILSSTEELLEFLPPSETLERAGAAF